MVWGGFQQNLEKFHLTEKFKRRENSKIQPPASKANRVITKPIGISVVLSDFVAFVCLEEKNDCYGLVIFRLTESADLKLTSSLIETTLKLKIY